MNRLLLALFFGSVLNTVGIISAHALEFEQKGKVVFVSGNNIDFIDSDRLSKTLANGVDTVVLSKIGGGRIDVLAGLGKLIRKAKVTTVAADSCGPSCAYLFMAGRERHYGWLAGATEQNPVFLTLAGARVEGSDNDARSTATYAYFREMFGDAMPRDLLNKYTTDGKGGQFVFFARPSSSFPEGEIGECVIKEDKKTVDCKSVQGLTPIGVGALTSVEPFNLIGANTFTSSLVASDGSTDNPLVGRWTGTSSIGEKVSVTFGKDGDADISVGGTSVRQLSMAANGSFKYELRSNADPKALNFVAKTDDGRSQSLPCLLSNIEVDYILLRCGQPSDPPSNITQNDLPSTIYLTRESPNKPCHAECSHDSPVRMEYNTIRAFAEAVRNRVRSNLALPPGDYPTSAEASFALTLSEEGRIEDIRLNTSSGYEAVDLAIKNALIRSAPLPKLTSDHSTDDAKRLLLKIRPFESTSRQGPTGPISTSVLWSGTYTVDSWKQVNDPTALTGKSNQFKGWHLDTATNTVVARLGTQFGVNFKFDGPVPGENVRYRTVWSFPAPGITNPVTGENRLSREREKTCAVGMECLVGWRIDEPWEVVPGKWKVEVWYGEKLVVSQTFEVAAYGQ